MKKNILALLLCAPAMAMGQSAIDAMQLTQPDFKGTARFMSMGGAYTALGGDLSAMSQNPAGIGVYRTSDIGITLDINFQNSSTDPAFPGFPSKKSQTKAYCNNFGYVGATNFDGALKTFNWGVSYGRAVSFDRVYNGYMTPTSTSLSNYVAAISDGIPSADLNFRTGFNPYQDTSNPWLSILAYSGYMINPTSGDTYTGLYKNGTVGDALYQVRERGYVDEYNISFGGNVENMVYWGLDFGITDIDYIRHAFYSESMSGALIPINGNRYGTGNAGFDLDNNKHISGSGWNMKIGLIFRPINEFRIGLAVHTPTWYKLSHGYDAQLNYSYYNPSDPNPETNPIAGDDYTDNAYFNWRLTSPWKFMVGMAGIFGTNAIISLDYQFDAYNSMKVQTPYYDSFDFITDYVDDPLVNQDIKNYFQGAHTLRLGAEYRVTPRFSVRAGFNYRTSYVKNKAADGNIEIYTSGTDPSYTFDKTATHVSVGMGYKYKSWYIDAAYVYKNRQSTYHAFTDYDNVRAPQSKLTDNNSSLILTTGIRF